MKRFPGVLIVLLFSGLFILNSGPETASCTPSPEKTSCKTASDCNGVAHDSCPGSFACVQGHCQWNCSSNTPDAAINDNGAPPPVQPAPTDITLTSTYFHATATTKRGISVWATERYPNPIPKAARNTTFWGRFKGNACASPGYGPNVQHPLSLPGITVWNAFYPDCSSQYGPGVDADVYAFGAPQHLLRCEINPYGAFQDFGPYGQNSSGANAYIQAIYVSFNLPWAKNVPNRLRPWGGPSTDPNRIRVALRIKESVNEIRLDDPGKQQLQQVVWMNVINENCDITSSSSYCQLQFNFKTFNKGMGAYTTFDKGDAFNDMGQGGLIAVVGPIGSTGQTTSIKGTPAWTSWGSSTQLAQFQENTFQVEISWNQFQQLLTNLTNGNPAAVFGPKWNDRQSWVLLDVGYGQENYNPSSTAVSVIQGMFENVEIFAL